LGDVPVYAAVIVTAVDAPTTDVVTVNGALDEPAGTVTLAGTLETAALLVDSATVADPAGAPVSVTVPCAGLPPMTLCGLIERDSVGVGVGDCGVLQAIRHIVAAAITPQLNRPVIERDYSTAFVQIDQY